MSACSPSSLLVDGSSPPTLTIAIPTPRRAGSSDRAPARRSLALLLRSQFEPEFGKHYSNMTKFKFVKEEIGESPKAAEPGEGDEEGDDDDE